MKPNEYYLKMVSSITEADVRLVAACMTDHIGYENSVKLGMLAARVSMDERKVREILAQLTKRYGWPIGGISGKAGRLSVIWIAASRNCARGARLCWLRRYPTRWNSTEPKRA